MLANRPAVLGRGQLRASGPLRLRAAAAPRAAPAPARLAAVAEAAEEKRMPPSPVRRVALDGSAAGEATLALHTAKEASAVGLVHRYLTMVRQNARRVRGRAIRVWLLRRGVASPPDSLRARAPPAR